MNFKDFYRNGAPRFSFEVFPAKTEEGVQSLLEALRDLSAFAPAFISVTYGALGSTRDLTRDLALRIRRELNLAVAFHFTCVGSGKAAIREYVERLKKEGVDLVVALRGDPPQGAGTFVKPVDGFSYANELVAYLKDIDDFSMAVAGYPEGHVECVDKETDLKNLKRKVEAGADIILTQLFFDNRDYFDFVDRARAIGIQVPIVPGIMPILSLKQIEKITTLSGAKIPPSLYEKLKQCGDDAERMRQAGIEHAASQCHELLQKGAPGIHFYILNKSHSTRRILERIRA